MGFYIGFLYLKREKSILIRQMSTETLQNCANSTLSEWSFCMCQKLYDIFFEYYAFSCREYWKRVRIRMWVDEGRNKWICIVHEKLPLENRCALFFSQKNCRSFNFNRIEKCSLTANPCASKSVPCSSCICIFCFELLSQV